jgi:NAD(P)-dependent dehydrogenase (short-subunit alcohol dehydrogenase family)
VVVTGAGRGIGAAMAKAFADGGARAVVVSDVDSSAAAAVAEEIVASGKTSVAVPADVSIEHEVRTLVERTEQEFGPVDLFCSNAGLAFGEGLDAPASDWERAWSVNVMPHVYAARAVLPSMVERGSGYLLNTASAAGLLTSPGDAPYAASKHAAVGFAEWLAVTYGSSGIGVSVLCPMGVRTELLMPHIEAGVSSAKAVEASGEILDPEQVAEIVLSGLEEERFLILPHPEVGQMYARKAADPDKWLAGMRRAFG